MSDVFGEVTSAHEITKSGSATSHHVEQHIGLVAMDPQVIIALLTPVITGKYFQQIRLAILDVIRNLLVQIIGSRNEMLAINYIRLVLT